MLLVEFDGCASERMELVICVVVLVRELGRGLGRNAKGDAEDTVHFAHEVFLLLASGGKNRGLHHDEGQRRLRRNDQCHVDVLHSMRRSRLELSPEVS